MEVSMEALPSFLGHKDVVVDVPGLGKVNLKGILGLSLLKPSSGHNGPSVWGHVVCYREGGTGNRQTRKPLL